MRIFGFKIIKDDDLIKIHMRAAEAEAKIRFMHTTSQVLQEIEKAAETTRAIYQKEIDFLFGIINDKNHTITDLKNQLKK